VNKLNLAVVAAVLGLATSAFAAGTNVDLQSARATGMASAVTANSPDPSAVFFNPAQIVEGGPKLRLLVGDTLILPHITFTPQGGSEAAVTNPVPPFFAYATLGITQDLAVGVGAFESYGLTLEWPRDFVGRSLLHRGRLVTYNINPEVAYRFGFLEIGAGLQIVRGTVDLTRMLEFPGAEGSLELGGAAWGIGGNGGVRASFMDGKLALAVAYRSQVKLNFDGHAHFGDVPPEFAGPASGQLHDQAVHTSLLNPDSIALGVSVQPIPALRINLDAVYFTWHVFRHLAIKFDDPALSQTESKHWTDTVNVHLGGEYDLSPEWSVRLGVMVDPTPSPADTLAPDVPDANRVNLAAGAGFHKSGFSADVGYQLILFTSTASTLPVLRGDYGGYVNAIALSLGYDIAL
jgi:long-chain fatty acid transport protein